MMHSRKRATALPLLLVAGILFGLCVSAAAPPVKRRGRLLRVEVLRTEEVPSFRVRLFPSSDSNLRLFFEEISQRIVHQANIYQTVIEVPAPQDINPSGVEYRVVPGELIQGETFAVRESEIVGPIAGETFLVNGVEMTTNETGVATDSRQVLLRPFDDLTVTELTLRARHERFGTAQFNVSRHVMKRYPADTGPPENLSQTDLLASMGIDFLPRRGSGREGVAMRVHIPETVRAGEVLEIALTVENQGDTATSSLLGRLFSRHEWLHGRLFYVGSVAPGESLTFARRIPVPAEARDGTAFAALGFWDLLGTIPDKGMVLRTAIEAVPAPPAEDLD